MTRSQIPSANTSKPFNPDLYNDHLLRQPNATDAAFLTPDPAHDNLTLAIPESEDDPSVRAKYRPFLLPHEVESSDWTSKLELSTALKLSAAAIYTSSTDDDRLGPAQKRLKVLVLYGSLRGRSYSRLLAYEYARILWRLGCDVRVFNPEGLPVKDDVQHGHEKVQELRELSTWSEGHVWVSPEQHGNLTAVFKNQIDWIPLSTGSVRPTQGRTLAVAQVSGGSQSFNSVNSLRILGRWMRMYVIPNQSSVPKAYEQFTEAVQTSEMDEIVKAEGGNRMHASGNRDRVVDCVEEFVKMSLVMRDWSGVWSDRYSERKQKKEKQEKDEREKKEREKKDGESDVLNGVNVHGI